MAKWRLRLIWAVLAALVTVWGVNAYLASLRQSEPVLVAATEIPARAQITADMLTVVHVNRTDRTQLAKASFRSKDEVVGRYARRRIEPGEVLMNRPGDFTESTQQITVYSGELPMAETLPPDTRAETVKLDQQAVLGKHVRVGDRVDLIFTSKSDSTGGVYSSLLLQQVQVLDIQRPPEDEPDKEVLVTFLVTAEQAVDLALAKRTGTIDLSLTPPDPGEPIRPRTAGPLGFIYGDADKVAGRASVPQSQSQTQQADTGKPPGR